MLKVLKSVKNLVVSYQLIILPTIKVKQYK